ncbi:D-alanyl-D-alanine carboxypeptidase family protein, partial [Dickeya dadantii]|nr:D-alanyl-D-alanine carboxypeptidase family protein [Dickeya dadantii]
GVEACKFQKEWFGDIQQYMLEFIDLWKKEKAKLN